MGESEFMVRDFVERPAQGEISKSARERLKSVLPTEAAGKKLVVLTRAVHSKCIIDAMADGRCDACGEAVWVSPSTKRVDGDIFYACTDCLGADLVWELAKGLFREA